MITARLGRAPLIEAGAVALGGLALALLLPALAPLTGLATALALAALDSAAAIAAHLADGRLLDPLLPALALVFAASLALILQAALIARAERALRQRMSQLLPPAVVTRLASNPRLLRLRGERRVVTALFTDLEGFTLAAQELPPEVLIATLDRYFTEVCGVILGDVGSGARIDYTAHGACVNMVARLESAGKVLGPVVIIGPQAAAQATQPLQPLGDRDLRSFGRVALFTLPAGCSAGN